MMACSHQSDVYKTIHIYDHFHHIHKKSLPPNPPRKGEGKKEKKKKKKKKERKKKEEKVQINNVNVPTVLLHTMYIVMLMLHKTVA